MNLKIEKKSSITQTEDLAFKSKKANELKKTTWGERFNLIKDYFVNSDEKLTAWLLLLGIIFCIIGLIALNVVLGLLFTSLWAALTAAAATTFFIVLAELATALCAMTLLYTLQDFLSGKLAIRWRSWLSDKIMKQLFGDDKAYINVKRTSEMNDIAQRIQEDVRQGIELAISLGSEFINSTLTLGVFLGTLWVVGGTLAFVAFGLNIVIPGFLVWVAIIIATTVSLITYGIGSSLPEINQKGEQAEARLRQNLEMFNMEAENIALEQTEEYHAQSIAADMKIVQDTANQKLGTQTLLTAFQNFNMNFSMVAPYLITAPLYFTGRIGLEQISQVGMSFSQVSQSLNWFAESYEKIAKCQAKIDRIIGIQHAIDQGLLKANPMDIVVKEKNSTSLIMKNLSIQKPLLSNNSYIVRNLNMELKQGEHTLLLGPSGKGKSTLFKAIRGVWSYGKGKIKLPKDKTQFFLSQKPTVVNDTLMAMLASPKPSSAYTKEQYLRAIRLVKYMDELIPDLEVKKDWAFLSGGQKQMVAFVRALLQKPDWLFLDEVTSSLDEDAEHYLYNLLKTELKKTTIVSIAHRSTVRAHHDRVIKFGCPNDQNVMEIVSDLKQVPEHSLEEPEIETLSFCY